MRWPTGGPAAVRWSWPAACRPPRSSSGRRPRGLVAFAVGFVVWGVGGALMSGTSEALVYDGLAAVGGEDSYVRVHGWMTAVELLVQVPTALLASVLFAVGGYALVGGSASASVPGAGLWRCGSPRPRGDRRRGRRWPMRRGVVAALRRPGLLLVVLAVALIGGLDAVEEYFPVLAADRGVPVTAVPVAILGIALAGAAGAALGGRAGRLPRPRAAAAAGGRGACVLALAVVLPTLLSLAAVAVFYGALPGRARRRRGAAAGPDHRPVPGDGHVGGGGGRRDGGAAGVRRLGGRRGDRGRRARAGRRPRGRRGPAGPDGAAGLRRA